MSDQLNIAVVGATGVVGETMLDILSKRKFPVGNIFALASERSIGKTVLFGNRKLKVFESFSPILLFPLIIDFFPNLEN